MSNIKDEVIAMIQKLPEDSDLTDIMAELYFRQKVEAGLTELDQGLGINHEQAKERLKKWLT